MLGRCHVGAAELDMFAHFLAAWHANIEPHKDQLPDQISHPVPGVISHLPET